MIFKLVLFNDFHSMLLQDLDLIKEQNKNKLYKPKIKIKILELDTVQEADAKTTVAYFICPSTINIQK